MACTFSSAGLPSMNRPNPHPPVAAYFFEFFTMNSIRGATPGTKVLANSADVTRFHASFARIVPSGNGSVFARKAFMAMLLPRITRISSVSSRWDGAMTCQSRYPFGIVTPVGAATISAAVAAGKAGNRIPAAASRATTVAAWWRMVSSFSDRVGTLPDIIPDPSRGPRIGVSCPPADGV